MVIVVLEVIVTQRALTAKKIKAKFLSEKSEVILEVYSNE
jgi:hypothetical protein